ncbi:MAG: PQQ-dependent sugar dehydrogenase [Planctomycetota bacterium]
MVGVPRPVAAVFPAGNPIDAVAPVTSWSLELEPVVTIPTSGGAAPRLETLVAGGQPGLAYVVDQRGPIWSFDPSAPGATPTLLLDVYDVVDQPHISNQTGVRGLAFHPDFAVPGADGFRTFYTAHSVTAASTPAPSAGGGPVTFASPGATDHYSVVAEWAVDIGGVVDPNSYRELMRVGQPFGDHNIGAIRFSPAAERGDADYGNLYIALGDGGSAFPVQQNGLDVFGAGQDLDTPLGGLLRINPMPRGGAPFTVPADNPFFTTGDATSAREAAWAYGLRNPSTFDWDPVSGRMLIADIGQSNIEEVNLGAAGANYGWGAREGTFQLTSGFAGGVNLVAALPADHTTDGLTYPVAQYDHDPDNDDLRTGSWAVAGGAVYRGTQLPELAGRYFFGDFGTNDGTLYTVAVDQLVQHQDFSDPAGMHGGFIAPIQAVQLTAGGAPTTLLDILRQQTGNPTLARTDLRFGVGPGGELYVLNKHDGVVRRFAAVTGLLAGDHNEDGRVDGADYAAWRSGLGDRFAPADLAGVLEHFGETLVQPGGVAGVSVPEPIALTVVYAMFIPLASRRAR